MKFLKENIKNYCTSFLENTKTHLQKIYCNKKHLIVKITIFFVIGFIVCLACFLMRNEILKANSEQWSVINGFLQIKITTNPGISFGSLANSSSSVVYFIQAIPVVIGIIVWVFSSNYLLDIGISLFFFGGLCNIIDRSLYDSFANNALFNWVQKENVVVDYFQFLPNSAIFNFADAFIIIGIILIVIEILISWIKEYIANKKEGNDKQLIKQEVLDEQRMQNKNKVKTIKLKKIKK
ncbi:MAG: signal peptidase II [Malacoplasma sp.]|nr:signal peptidase II [Malacoplasma sp.]